MHRILIVEDDISQAKMLEVTICSQYSDWNITVATSYDTALFHLQNSIQKKEYFTLFLLDIQLSQVEGDRGGFIFANELRKLPPYFKTLLLFLTAVSDENYFALSNYHCYNYIAKPYSKEDILFQLQQMLFTGYLEENALKLTDVDHIQHQLLLSSIQYIQAKGHFLTINLTNGKVVSRDYTLSGILQKLNDSFIRCHKSIIINKNYLSSIDKRTRSIIVASHSIPVGRKYLPDIENLL